MKWDMTKTWQVHGEQEDRGEILEQEFSRAAALMVAGMGDCPRAQAECLRLGIPQMLWKVCVVGTAAGRRPKILLLLFFSRRSSILGARQHEPLVILRRGY